MCVIAIATLSRPTPEQIEKMWAANPHGAGVSWVEKGAVRWLKGLAIEKVIDFAEKMPLPYVLHFRIPTAGGNSIEMLHPFELGGNCKPVGISKRGVLFHNGHWTDHSVVLATLRASLQGRLPGGPWSDSRVMAYISRYGTEWLDDIAIHQRICVQTPTGIEMFGRWQENTKGCGLWFSNEGWRSAYPRRFPSGAVGRAYRWNKQTRKMEEIITVADPPNWLALPTPAGTGSATGTGRVDTALPAGPVVSAFPPAASTAPAQPQGAAPGGAAGAPKPEVAAQEGLIIEGPHPNGVAGDLVVWIRESAGLGGRDAGTFKRWNRYLKTKAGTLIQDNFPTAPRGLTLLATEDPITQGWAKCYDRMSQKLRVMIRDDATGEAIMTPASLAAASALDQTATPTGTSEQPDVLGTLIDHAKRFFGQRRTNGHEGAAERLMDEETYDTFIEREGINARTYAD